MTTFPEAVAAAHDWAAANDATVSIAKNIGIDGGDGRFWTSFVVNTIGAPPGAFAAENPEITEFFRKHDDSFSFTVG